ncbi:DUF4861 domain-containing protein [Simiduia agarivorans]|uniref:DUF4861 domain-containing protein n=1 Tax=Simiduia agarivorans (strain DSM 21679 / JCM 13881 / BCRC 17597 / SA1) TaxID=1117647 RepID=K4KIF5_SIMAS|nr:DUF4861 domain-containing protein [Simiduia agarivorans]AFU98806.1 hypothetical protein M5M_08085 [Simiduia agarivorans SA1 = DSM 21679]
MPTIAFSRLCVVAALASSACTAAPSVTVEATNSLDQGRAQARICLPFSNLKTKGIESEPVVLLGQQRLAVSAFDCDGDQQTDSWLTHADFGPRETLTFTLASSGGARLSPQHATATYAELAQRVNAEADKEGVLKGGQYVSVNATTLPANHTVGDKLYKYEGLGWESARVAYRVYFDARNAIDIFGKQVSRLVLPEVGLDGGDYHTLADWGMDVLKVGPSLGLGSPASLGQDGRLVGINQFAGASAEVFNTPAASGIALNHRGWQSADGPRDTRTEIWIEPDSLLSRVSVHASAPIARWATGIVRHGVDELRGSAKQGEWNYLASYGKQSLADDALGMAIFYRETNSPAVDNEYNLLQDLGSGNHQHYYLAAAWRQPESQTKSAFQNWLAATQKILNHPIQVVVK